MLLAVVWVLAVVVALLILGENSCADPDVDAHNVQSVPLPVMTVDTRIHVQCCVTHVRI